MNLATSLCTRLTLRELVTYKCSCVQYCKWHWATKKAAGSTKNGRDSKPKNHGVKKFGGERVIPGNIIVRSTKGQSLSSQAE